MKLCLTTMSSMAWEWTGGSEWAWAEVEPLAPQSINNIAGPGISKCPVWRYNSVQKICRGLEIWIKRPTLVINFRHYELHECWYGRLKDKDEFHTGRTQFPIPRVSGDPKESKAHVLSPWSFWHTWAFQESILSVKRRSFLLGKGESTQKRSLNLKNNLH